MQLRSTEGIARGIGLCEQALVLESGNANAHAELAFGRFFVAIYTQEQQRDRATALRSMRLAKEHADLAISINPTLAYPYMARGFVAWLVDHDAASRIKDAEIALSLAPDDPEILRQCALCAMDFGRFDEARALLARAKDLDPLSIGITFTKAMQLRFSREFDEALELAKRVLQETLNNEWAQYHLGVTAWAVGQHGLAAECLARSVELRGDAEAAASLRHRYAEQGWQHFLRGLAEGATNMFFTNYYAAAARAELGDLDGAFAVLEDCMASQNQSISCVKVDPLLDPLRGDPRYVDLIRRIGFPE